MRRSIFILLILFNFSFVDTYGQDIIANTCDSTLLTKQEYEKCKSDTAWTTDILGRINYIINLKTGLLPKYRVIRKALTLSNELQSSLRVLKTTYDSVLNKKISVFHFDMDRNQKYVQPKAYLSSLLSLQVFKLYPDIYAILLNDIHLKLTPNTTTDELIKYSQLVDNVLILIPPGLYQQLEKITSDLTADNAELMKQGFIPQFQGIINEAIKKRYGVINFLLWTE